MKSETKQLFVGLLLLLATAGMSQADLLEAEFNGVDGADLDGVDGWVSADPTLTTYASGSNGNPFATSAVIGSGGTVRYDKAMTKSISLAGGGVYTVTSDVYAFEAVNTDTGSAQSGIALMDSTLGAAIAFEYQYEGSVKWRLRVYDGLGGSSKYYVSPLDVSGFTSLSMTLDLTAGTLNGSVTTAGGTVDFSEITLPSTLVEMAAVRVSQDRRSSREGMWVDNIHVTPEPATMILLASGAGMCLLKKRPCSVK